MPAVESLFTYKQLLTDFRKRVKKSVSNCCCMPSYFEPYIKAGRLTVEEYSSVLCVFADEERYETLYYYIEPGSELPSLARSKPVLVERIGANEVQLDETKEAKRILGNAGFQRLKQNHQYIMKLSDDVKNIDHQMLSGYEHMCCWVENEALAEQVIGLWETALDPTDIPEDHRHFLESGTDHVLCVQDHEKLMGAVWFRFSGGSCEERHIVIHPDYQRRGLASMLLREGIHTAKDYGVHRVTTWISDSNQASISLHIKAGFEVTPRSSVQYILQVMK